MIYICCGEQEIRRTYNLKKIHTGIIFQTIIGMLVIALLVLGYTFILQRNYNLSLIHI